MAVVEQDSSAAFSSSGSGPTISVTPAGTDTMVFVVAIRAGSAIPSGIDIDGIAATQLGSDVAKGYFGQSYNIWYRLGVPTGSALNVNGLGGSGSLLAVAFSGVDQANPFGTIATVDTGAANPASVDAIAADVDAFIVGVLSTVGGTGLFVPDGSATVLQDHDQDGSGQDSILSIIGDTANATSETISATRTGPNNWSAWGVQINAATASSGGVVVTKVGDIA